MLFSSDTNVIKLLKYGERKKWKDNAMMKITSVSFHVSVTTILLIYLMYSTFTSTLSLATSKTSSCHLINFLCCFMLTHILRNSQR